MRSQRRLAVTVFWEIHETILQVADWLKCHSLKASESSKTSNGFELKGSVSLKRIILAGSFVRRDKLKTQRHVPKNWLVIRGLTTLSGTLQEVHGEYCDCKVPVNLLAITLAQVYVGFKVEIITKPQTLMNSSERKLQNTFMLQHNKWQDSFFKNKMLLCRQQAYHVQLRVKISVRWAANIITQILPCRYAVV